MFLSRNKKKYLYPYKPQFYCIKVGFKGSNLYRRVFVMCSYVCCPPPFRRKAEGHCFWLSVVRGAWCVVRGAWFRIFSRYLVPLTPPTVFVRSFWSFTGALRMVWKYACVFFPESWNYFYHFLHIFHLDTFWVLILQKSIGSRYLVPLTPPIVFGRSFWNFTWAFRMVWRYACGFFRILKLFLSLFTHFPLRHFLSSNITEVYRE